MNAFLATLRDPLVRVKTQLESDTSGSLRVRHSSAIALPFWCYSHLLSKSLTIGLEPHRMPINPEWPEKKVTLGTLAGLGSQTKSLHETLALRALMSSKLYFEEIT